MAPADTVNQVAGSIVKAFRNEQIIAITVADLSPVVNDVTKHFKDRGFETEGIRTASGSWDISSGVGRSCTSYMALIAERDQLANGSPRP